MGVFKTLLVMTVCFIVSVDGVFDQCKFPRPNFIPEDEVIRYGKPTPYVITKSIGVSPYSLTDPYRQSAVHHEYLLIGPGITNHADTSLPRDLDNEKEYHPEEEIILILYDQETIHEWDLRINLVEQNLKKEYYWAVINATGMLPSMTIINATFEKTYSFHSEENDDVSYHLAYPNLFRSRETVPPLDVIIEFPAKTGMFQSLKTMIDYQTFGLLRWRLTLAEPLTWTDIRNKGWEAHVTIKDPKICSLPPTLATGFLEDEYLQCGYLKRFKVIENPCIKDMIILFTIRSNKGVPGVPESYLNVNRLLMVIPMVYDLLDYQGWIDLTEAYCPRPDEDEECGEPLDIVLTNDHLLILSDKGLWVSNSLNASNVNVSYPYSMKPLLKFTPIDPCAQLSHFNCSEVGAPVLARQAFRRQRLFYTPVCHLFQYPVYEDMVMLAIDHISQAPDMSHERDVLTVLYAAKPYNDWKMLFFARHEYITVDGPLAIAELLGIFFNHHRRHFDITLLLKDLKKGGLERTIRFVLPLPTNQSFEGYEELNGVQGDGFLEFEFPINFRMTHLTVNPEPLDVFFLGDQIWIAEAGGPFVYISVPHVTYPLVNGGSVTSTIAFCSFNHPDRAFVCLEKTHTKLYTGRVGVTYSSSSVLFSDINELRYATLYSEWPFAYRQYIAFIGQFVAGYSGKIMLWYIYDHNDLVSTQNALLSKKSTHAGGDCLDDIDQPVTCHVCQRITLRTFKHGCVLHEEPELAPSFKMLSIDTSKLRSGDAVLDGPLVPVIRDGDSVILFEANIPELTNYKPFRDYFADVDIGSRIFCEKRVFPDKENKTSPEDPPKDDSSVQPVQPHEPYNVSCPSMIQEERVSNCELFVRTLKSFERNGKDAFLKGFRSVMHVTAIDSFPFRPIPTDFVVLVLPDSNDAIIQLSTLMFEPRKEYTFQFSDVGQSLYIPDHFTVFLKGFPKFQECSTKESPLLFDMTRMVGITTRYYRQGARIQVKPFHAYLIDLSTPGYCHLYRDMFDSKKFNYTECVEDPQPSDAISKEYRDRRADTNKRRTKQFENRQSITRSINSFYTGSFQQAGAGLNLFEELKSSDSGYYQLEDSLLTVTEPAIGDFSSVQLKLNVTYDADNFNPQKLYEKWQTLCDVPSWEVFDGGCHLRLYLAKNPVLKRSGGRISLDKFDFMSFQVRLRPLTPIGKSLIHRPLIAVTNTNPKILTVDQADTTGRGIQSVNITLSPTGFGTGVAAVTIRPLIVSTECEFADGSITFIVQVHRAPGRRLHVNYPIPICKPVEDEGGYERPWKIDLPNCVTRDELMENKEVTREKQVFYSTLPVNYRPPSYRGAEIPLSKYIYNADPSLPWYKTKYRVSKETGGFGRCEGEDFREDCDCSHNDALSDDVIFTDCKTKVYTAKRGFRVDISVEYDRIMRDKDQHLDFFVPKKNWSVFLEEVNERWEFTLNSLNSPYLELINKDSHFHQGRKHYDARTLGVTLHGTGLFHFKVSLSKFESFDEVSGYFMIFVPDDQLNHVQLVVVMLLTITICMAFVFCGFLLVRRRLSSQLPFQTQTSDKIKLE